MMKILLASASPRRKELIHFITDEVRIFPSSCEEVVPEHLDARETVEYLSKLKGEDVAPRAAADEITVSADTVVAVDGKILGKPKDYEDGKRMLAALSGKTHQVYTGVTLIKGEKAKTFSVKTDVTFYPLTEKDIENYLDTGEPFDKAGAYGIQGKGCVLVEKINGDYFNVVGLPVSRLMKELKDF